MKNLSYILFLVALFFTTQAQARVFASVGVADVAVVEVQLDPLTQYEWHAEVTAGNADLVLHIVQSGKDLYRAFSPGQTSATLQFFSLFGGPATLVVRSVSGAGQINLTQRKGLGRRIRLLSTEADEILASVPSGTSELMNEVDELANQVLRILKSEREAQGANRSPGS